MNISYNQVFKELLTEFNLNEDLIFQVELPKEIQGILDDQILFTDHGITLKSFNNLYKAKNSWENQSIIEDSENHFHVDWHIDPSDEKKVFMLGVKTLILLADKFQKAKVKGVRFWYSFQTPLLGQLWAKQNNLDENDEHHLISDRLSFYKIREGESVVPSDHSQNMFWATLIIDI